MLHTVGKELKVLVIGPGQVGYMCIYLCIRLTVVE